MVETERAPFGRNLDGPPRSLERDSVTLRYVTPPDWAPRALEDFDSFLLDHASCERKASAVGMSFVVRYPDREKLVGPMIQFAREELEHFHQVFRLIERRGLRLRDDEPDEYVNQMMVHVRTGRDERLLDRLIVSALIEARGHERLSLVTDQLSDPALKDFYGRLARAEAHHHHFFLEMAGLYFSPKVLLPRLETFLDLESESIRSVPYRSALH
jgi:tRNA 2-(methylsulfanyl)-N6-isopentenyladenosine37 hydroxylase